MANYQNITPKQLGQTAITTGYTTVYTAPALTRIYVKQADFCNTTAGALSVYFHLVPSGGSAGTGNAIYYAKAIAANDNLQWKGVHIMHAGDTLQVKGSGAGIAVTISGAEAV